jgi:predicted outer membrane repeat protein
MALVLRGFRIKNGNASLGGGIYLEGVSKILLTDVALTSNTAFQGGAIYNEGTLSLTRSLVNSNSNSASPNAAGGGIYNAGAQSVANLVNSTLTQNTSLSGGAVFNAGNLLMINNTVSHNTASNAASSVYNAGTANVLNTIIGMDNTAVSSLSGAFVSMGGNLITDARGSTGFTNGANGDQVSDNNTVNPMLGDLNDNGGETETRVPLAGSPAINHGNNCVLNAACPSPYPWQSGYHLQTDQRTNYKRVSEAAVDVGAVESNTTLLNLNGSWGTFNNSPRWNGCRIVTTNAATNEKQYRPTNPFGNFELSGLTTAYIYILERQCKRAGNSFAWVADFETYPF